MRQDSVARIAALIVGSESKRAECERGRAPSSQRNLRATTKRRALRNEPQPPPELSLVRVLGIVDNQDDTRGRVISGWAGLERERGKGGEQPETRHFGRLLTEEGGTKSCENRPFRDISRHLRDR